MDKVSYALGIGIGRQLASMGAESLNIDDFAQAVKDAIAGKLQLGEQEAQELVQNFFAEQEAKAQAAAAEKGKVAKEAGEKFLAENGKKEGLNVELDKAIHLRDFILMGELIAYDALHRNES